MKKEHGKWYVLFSVIIIILLSALCIYPVETITILFVLGLALFCFIGRKSLESFDESFKKEDEKNGRFRHP